MDTKQPKHQVEFDPYGGYDCMSAAYSIRLLSLPDELRIVVDLSSYPHRLQNKHVRELLESVAKFLDAEWETRLDYPYEITVRLGMDRIL